VVTASVHKSISIEPELKEVIVGDSLVVVTHMSVVTVGAR
jgi:hypothetical protein